MINLEEDFALTFKLGSDRFGQISALTKPYLRNVLYSFTPATLKNGLLIRFLLSKGLYF